MADTTRTKMAETTRTETAASSNHKNDGSNKRDDATARECGETMTGTADRMGNETTGSLLFNRQIERGGPVARRYQPDGPTRRRLNHRKDNGLNAVLSLPRSFRVVVESRRPLLRAKRSGRARHAGNPGCTCVFLKNTFKSKLPVLRVHAQDRGDNRLVVCPLGERGPAFKSDS